MHRKSELFYNIDNHNFLALKSS